MARLPDTEQSLLRHLRAEKRQRLRNENASPYSRSGMSVTADGVVTLDGEIDITGLAKIIGQMLVQGNLGITGPTTVGGTLNVTGNTTLGAPTTISGTLGVTGVTTLGAATTVSGSLDVTGPMTVGGTLSLPAGIINNDALANPITYGSNKATSAGGATTTTRTNVATASITVPAGFTKAVVWAFADALAMNSTASPDYLYVATAINAYDGGENYAPCQSGYATTVTHAAATQLTGLTPGGAVNCIVSTRTNTAPWAASGSNLWRIQGVALFTR